MRVDLHLHSNASDGALGADALVREAHAGGLHVIALTDHDTTAGVGAAQKAAVGMIHVVPGIEISTTHQGHELHMLGYYIDPDNAGLRGHEGAAIERRFDRMVAILDSLRLAGVDVSIDAVRAAAGDARVIARPHLARILVERGHANNFADAFDRWIGDACPAYHAINLVTPREAIDRIHDAGGIASWAHPDTGILQRDIAQFANWGIDAIECFRPRSTIKECEALEATANRFGLMATGGSDWHGHWSGKLGTFSLGREELAAFLDRGDI